MSAEVPTPPADGPPARSRVARSNRRQMLLFAARPLMLLVTPGREKVKSRAEMKKKKSAVLADGDNSAAFVRSVLEISDGPDGGSRVQMAPPNSTFEKLFASGGYGAAIAIAHTSKIIKDKSYAQSARHVGFTLNAIDRPKALAVKNPGISEERLTTGMLSSSPAIPADDLDTTLL